MNLITVITFGIALSVVSAAPRPQASEFDSYSEDDYDTRSIDDGSGDYSDCGRSNNLIDLRVLGEAPTTNYAALGEFPHMCVVFYKKDGSNVYVGGASLVQTNLVMTLASAVRKFTDHKTDRVTDPVQTEDDYEEVDLRNTDKTCKNEFTPKAKLFVRCGDIKIQAENTDEITIEVETILLHSAYSDTQLVNDIAVLVLKTDYEFSEHVGRVCLPAPGREVDDDETECVATGHGKDNFGAFGYYSETLRKVSLPLVDNKNCQKILNEKHFQNTSIKSWQMDESFICAGGEAGKDTCEGDGGSPLVCQLSQEDDFAVDLREEEDEKLTQVGIVAWGIGCGQDIPAVYTKVAHPPVRCWLDEIINCHGNGLVDLRTQDVDLRSTEQEDPEVLEGCEAYHKKSRGGCCDGEEEEEYDNDSYDYDVRQDADAQKTEETEDLENYEDDYEYVGDYDTRSDSQIGLREDDGR